MKSYSYLSSLLAKKQCPACRYIGTSICNNKQTDWYLCNFGHVIVIVHNHFGNKHRPLEILIPLHKAKKMSGIDEISLDLQHAVYVANSVINKRLFSALKRKEKVEKGFLLTAHV